MQGYHSSSIVPENIESGTCGISCFLRLLFNFYFLLLARFETWELTVYQSDWEQSTIVSNITVMS